MRILFFFIFSLSVSFYSIGQTSIEEYNYITKGYKVQIESGLDMKKGYELKEIDYAYSNGPNGTITRQAWLKGLYRLGSNGTKVLAAYMIIYQLRDKTDSREYICIPNPKSSDDIIAAYWKTLFDGTTLSSERLQLISYLVSRNLRW